MESFVKAETHQKLEFYRLSSRSAVHYENLKPHVSSLEHCCIPRDIESEDYLAVERGEKATWEKNNGYEATSLCDRERIEESSKKGSFVRED